MNKLNNSSTAVVEPLEPENLPLQNVLAVVREHLLVQPGCSAQSGCQLHEELHLGSSDCRAQPDLQLMQPLPLPLVSSRFEAEMFDTT